MTNNEKKFWDILTNLFVGAEVKGKSGFINLMRAKQNYFKKVKVELLKQIDDICKDNQNFKDELYDKLYSFFHRYFSESGSIYYNYTPLFYNIYTKAYDENKNEIKTFSTDYEQIISNKQDTSLFYKTQMLYYVKSDKIFKDLEIEIEKYKYIFDVSNMEGKKANEKKSLVYNLVNIENNSLEFSVIYSEKGRVTKIDEILKECKKQKLDLKEEELKKAFTVFERQANIDYFINKNAKKFLDEQLDMWIYQYMFSQEANFDITRFNQIQDFKNIAKNLIDFIGQFENELVKIWNKPRFVLNSNIVVTINKLKEKGFEIEKLKNHKNYKEQEKEWEELGITANDGLVENEFLPIDTKYFCEFKEQIEELFSEDELDGLLIKSENYQALNSIKTRFDGKIDLIYIDPPFNTGDDFAYIDRFQDSTWLSLMENRLEIAKDILSKKGSFYLHLDEKSNYRGRELLNKIFDKDSFQNEIIWSYRRWSAPSKKFQAMHDSILYYSKYPENKIFNEIYVKPANEEKGVKEGYQLDEEGRQFRWQSLHGKRYKIYRDERGVLAGDVWEISFLHPSSKERIEGALTQKTEMLMNRIISASSNPNSIVLDYHLGSGTTVATAHKLGRKFIGIEMGEHFYDVVIPRMKKVLSGFASGISKDVEYKGGGIFKYYELEQYEEILRSTVFCDVPNEYLESKKSDEIKDCFLFDEKLSKVIFTKDDKFEVDLEKLYANIDLKETIFNLTGKKPKQITNSKVVFEDSEYELLEILKPLLVW